MKPSRNHSERRLEAAYSFTNPVFPPDLPRSPAFLQKSVKSVMPLNGKFRERLKKIRKQQRRSERKSNRSATLSESLTSGESFLLDTVAQLRVSNVNADTLSRYLLKQLKRSARLSERVEIKQVLLKKLRKFGFYEVADKFEKCSANFTSLVCPNGHSFNPIPDFRCYLPICADCSEVKSHRELKRILPKFLQVLKDNPQLIIALLTLTLRSDKKRGLRAGNSKIKKDFARLRERDIFANCVGGFGRVENTSSPRFGYHPHIHSLILLKDYIPQDKLSDNWQSITNDSEVIDIREVKDISAGLVECIKYPFKLSDLRKLGKQQIQEMLDSKGQRLGVTFGALFGLEVGDEIEQTLENEYYDFVEETKNLKIGDCCPICAEKLDLIDFSAHGYSQFLASTPVPNSNKGHPLSLHILTRF